MINKKLYSSVVVVVLVRVAEAGVVDRTSFVILNILVIAVVAVEGNFGVVVVSVVLLGGTCVTHSKQCRCTTREVGHLRSSKSN